METSYRDILNQSLQDRNLANPSYSMRSFARDLGIPPSTLSEILNGKKGISVKRSEQFAAALKMPGWQSQLFCDLVAKEHAKSPAMRSQAKARLKDRKQENHLKILNQTAMRSLTSWVDLAILELTYLKEFKPSPSWIAKKLGVEEGQIAQSVSRLKTAKLLEVSEKDGSWVDVSPLFSSSDGIPSESVRLFQGTILRRGLKALENRSLEDRTVKSVVFSISNANLPRAKQVLDEAIAKIVSLADESSQEREQVMCFSSQLFSLIEGRKETK